jgi:iron-sulfur cluster repair protein YtfE (RIC family)
MKAIESAMSGQHRHCDDLLAGALAQIANGLWDQAAGEFRHFREELGHHLQAEESVLFPAFEESTGMAAGPTAMMRQEHERLRALAEQIELALAARDAGRVDGYTSTLQIMLRQHNLKEENVLYPMCDSALGDDARELVSQLDLSAFRRA